MKLTQRTGFLYLLVGLQWSVTIDPCSAYFQASVGGYLFSIPDIRNQEWRTQVDAQSWCTINQSKLLEITSDSLQSSVVAFINNAISQNLMTGNNVITNGKRYRDSTFAWVNGHPIGSSQHIYGQEPGLVHSYGYMNWTISGNAFVADAPTVTRGYICEGSSFCSGGLKLNERCYKSYSNTLSWFGARNRCLDGGGGDLASFEFIPNAQGFNALNGLGLIQPSTYWVGLRRQWWTWQGSSSEVKYSQWSDGHPVYASNPNKDCICLFPNNPTYDWKWTECDCSRTYQFVCLAETPSTLSSTSVSTANVISSTKIKTGTTTSQLHVVNSPKSISNPEYSTTTTVSNGSVSAGSGYKLPVGLGVGLGGGALIVAIIVIVVVVVQRKGCHRQHGLQKPTPEPPDVTPESYYASVVKNPEYDDTAIDVRQIPPPTEYADLNIVAISQSPDEKEQSRRSFV